MAQEVRDIQETKETKESKEVKKNKNEKPKRDFMKFFREIKGELKKVIWPDRKQLFNNTITVLATCIFVGAIIWVVDVLLEMAYMAVFK